ncbi:MAG: DUF309 domain-containing protein [Gemmataceae bacterium]
MHDEQLPPYSYVPGLLPHPVSDPAGYLHGKVMFAPCQGEPAQFLTCQNFLRGIDLFNHGFYWEAHEAWERCWHTMGRRGPRSLFLQGLIKLAAAAVKVREGKSKGTRHLAAGAQRCFDQARLELSEVGLGAKTWLLLSRLCQEASDQATDHPDQNRAVRVLFSVCLQPNRDATGESRNEGKP